jgi:hypothetical protein
VSARAFCWVIGCWICVCVTVADCVNALARRMHRVCAEVAGCYAKSANLPVRLGFSVTISGCVGRPSPMADISIRFAVLELAIVDGARPNSRRMRTDLQNLNTGQTG